jgi:hypothetical protein
MKTPILKTPDLTILAEPGHTRHKHSANITHILGDFLITQHGMTWPSEKITVERKTELDGVSVKPYLVYHV